MDKIIIHANQKTVVSRKYVEDGTLSPTPPTDIFLRARQRDADVVLIDKVATIGDRTAEATLDPGDLSVGLYRGWLHLVLADLSTRDTEEFELTCLEHAPGTGIRTGRIYSLARLKVPVAWDALRGYSDYGDFGLMQLIWLVERRAMGHSLTLPEEAGADQLVQNYLAHLAAIEAIPAAIDFWTNQIVSQTARGSSEVQTFPDRIKANEEQLKRLEAKTAQLRAEAEEALGTSLGKPLEGMALVDGGDPITPGVDQLAAYWDPAYYANTYVPTEVVE